MDQSKINRRGFLGTIGAAATGLALATQGTAETQETDPKLPPPGSNRNLVIRTLPRTGEKTENAWYICASRKI